MKKQLHTTLLGLFIFLILSCFVVVADTAKTTTSEIKYQRFFSRDPEGRKYHRFLLSPTPEELIYVTRLKAEANIDDTPEKETLVLILVYMRANLYEEGWMQGYGESWIQAFLFIAEADTKAKLPKKKDAFKFFDAGKPALDVPAAKAIKLQNPSFVFAQPPADTFKSRDLSFRLVDLTGDGTLDVWIESIYGVAVVSFQNGEFKEIFSAYTIPTDQEAEYVDLDDNGSCEIKIPYSIQIEGMPGVPYLPWMSLYEWDGTTYTLNNEKFYAGNNDYFIPLLSQYNYQLLRHGEIINLLEPYKFYLGLVSYYRSGVKPGGLQWVVEHGRNEHYIQAAKSILKKFLPEEK